MTRAKSFLVALLAATAGLAAAPAPKTATSPAAAPPAAAAPKLKQYWFVMLRKGPNRGQDEATAEKIQEGHMAHLRETAASGKLVVAGPFGDDGDWRGILIYDVATREEAEGLCGADPAVKAGRIVCDIHPWWTQPGATLK